jgi:hypothetical protein
MGDLRIHPRTFITAGIMAFIFIWAVNRGLSYAGLGSYMA